MATVGKNISRSIITRYTSRASFGDVLYGPQGQFGPLLQREYQIVLILEGSLDLQIDGRWRHVTAGHAVLCLPGRRTLFRFDRERPTRHQWCTIYTRTISPALRRAIGTRGDVLPIPPAMPSLMLAAWEADSSEEFPTLHPLAEAVFATFLAARRSRDTDHGPEALRRARHFIAAHYATSLDLPAIARHAGVTPNHLIRIFREHAAITPAEYLWQVRLDHSLSWLRDTGLSISEIAYRAGFQSAFHFSRRFKARYGASPLHYRQSLDPAS